MNLHLSITTLFVASSLPIILAATNTAASEARIDSIEQAFALSEVVVTGTRTPKILKDTPIQTRLITSADLRQADASNLQDLLQTELPGVEFSYAMNQQVNMNLAGFAGQSVLILIDGERLAGETMDNVDFSRLSMQGVERIEIVKGASSALYGSNAAGGVVNIITKKADKPWKANVNVRRADHNEWRTGINFSAKSRLVANVADFSHSSIDTYTVCLDPSDQCDFRKVYGNKIYNFQDRLSIFPTDNLSVTARAGYYFKERYYNIDTPDRYRDFTAGVRAEYNISDKDNLELSYAFDQYDKSDFLKDQNLDIRDYRNTQNSLRALYSHSFQKVLLTTGGDLTRDYLDTYQFAADKAKSQTTADVFAQADWTINDKWELIGAVRYDYFSDTNDSRATGKISGRYKWSGLCLRGGYAGGFRAPTLKEKYMNFDMAGIFDIHGNPLLKPEVSHNLNLSAEYTRRNYNFTISGNHTFIDDKITTSGIMYGADGLPYIYYMNVNDLKVTSIEMSAQGRWNNGIGARLSYAFTHEQTDGGKVTQYCPARPHAITARCSWQKDWSKKYSTELIVNGRFLSRVSYMSMYMYEPFEEKKITNPAYTLWKVQLNQEICQSVSLSIAVDNIFNYAPKVYSYNAPITLGANLMVGVSVELDRLFD